MSQYTMKKETDDLATDLFVDEKIVYTVPKMAKVLQSSPKSMSSKI